MQNRLRALLGEQWPAALMLLGLLLAVNAAVCFGPASHPPELPPGLLQTLTPTAP